MNTRITTYRIVDVTAAQLYKLFTNRIETRRTDRVISVCAVADGHKDTPEARELFDLTFVGIDNHRHFKDWVASVRDAQGRTFDIPLPGVALDDPEALATFVVVA